MLYKINLLEPITGISAVGIKGERVDKIDWNSNSLYFSEEIHSVVCPKNIKLETITLADQNKLPMGEYKITSLAIYRQKK